MALHSTVNWIEGQVAAWKHSHDAPTVPVASNINSADEPLADTGTREEGDMAKSGGLQGEVGRSKPAPLVYLSGHSPRHFMGGEWNMGGGCQDMSVSLSLLSDELRF